MKLLRSVQSRHVSGRIPVRKAGRHVTQLRKRKSKHLSQATNRCMFFDHGQGTRPMSSTLRQQKCHHPLGFAVNIDCHVSHWLRKYNSRYMYFRNLDNAAGRDTLIGWALCPMSPRRDNGGPSLKLGGCRERDRQA